ncbi:MAG TPA: hypothetical protein VGN16_25505 [Acidobacteriaceae bacterium]
MSTLGLDDRPSKDENFFQRLFWPSPDPSEVDTLGRQGFWLCLILGVLSLVFLVLRAQPLSGAVALLFFFLGGIGVREHSVTSAIYVAGAYAINICSVIALGSSPGPLDLIAFGLLLANIRGTWIASRWMKRAGHEAFPDRMSETLGDKMADRMPAAVWPKLSMVFYVLGGVYLLLSVFGMLLLAMHGAYTSRSY